MGKKRKEKRVKKEKKEKKKLRYYVWGLKTVNLSLTSNMTTFDPQPEKLNWGKKKRKKESQ